MAAVRSALDRRAPWTQLLQSRLSQHPLHVPATQVAQDERGLNALGKLIRLDGRPEEMFPNVPLYMPVAKCRPAPYRAEGSALNRLSKNLHDGEAMFSSATPFYTLKQCGGRGSEVKDGFFSHSHACPCFTEQGYRCGVSLRRT
ncbi:unnamed protein product [Pleuronectes platessa]|uniref:Uncharacterized protein n=1 Tax=Pleuronectes platessa TaxID=8262 RepID=A0A9N7Z2Z5_PLEPL|nr:unnamed protein product [Pleuronectes platessa]